MSAMQFQILGIGAWGPGFSTWPELSAIFSGQADKQQGVWDAGSTGPKPEVIPANERRRAPLQVRLAVESSWQAAQDANLDPAELPCVFVSGIGDTQLTDYMCQVLATDNKALSPTKFHNSVHNAAAGYWTISTGCMQASSSIAGFQESVSLTLMEAAIQCQSAQQPILITFYDAPSSEVLKELLINELPFAVSLVMGPAGSSSNHPGYLMEIENQPQEWPEFAATALLEHCYATNPAARILPFLQNIALQEAIAMPCIAMPMSAESSIKICLASD